MKSKKEENRTRLYRKEWRSEKDFRGWLCQAPVGTSYAYCKWCRSTLRSLKSDLDKHYKRPCHIQRGETMISHAQRSLAECGIANVNNSDKIIDIKLVAFFAAHSSINGIDHLCELLKDYGKGSPLGKLKLHRTKAFPS